MFLSLSQPTAIATVATTADPSPLPSFGSGSVSEWGLMGVLVVLTFQKGWEIFIKKEDAESALVKQLIEGLQGTQSKKDSAESDLVGKLIEGLRENQSQMLGQMVRMTERSHDDIKELKDAILTMTCATQKELEEAREEFETALQEQTTAIADLRVMLSQLRRDLQARQGK